MRKLEHIGIAMVFIIVLTSCAEFKLKMYSDINLEVDYKYCKYPNKKTMERLLAEIWDSGFINRNKINEEEIKNNKYGIFKKTNAEAYFDVDRACYVKTKGKRDKILLNKRLFPHFEAVEGRDIIRTGLDKRIKATLVHELFHDFWHNLLNSQERDCFSIKAKEFYEEIKMATTSEDKLKFLRDIGYVEPIEDNFTYYQELDLLRIEYPKQKFFGTELYAILAERTFSGKMIIPQLLREFYKGIISETSLNKNCL